MKTLLTSLLGLFVSSAGFSQWQNEGPVAFSAGQVSYLSLEFNQDTAYLAYRDQANGNKASLQKFDGTNWVYVGGAGLSTSGALSTDLTFFNNNPFVAYVDASATNSITVKTYLGGSWINAGSAGFTGVNSDDPTIDFAGPIPYVAYQDGSNGSRASCMRLTGATWEQVGTAGFTPGIAFDVNLIVFSNVPYVCYKDATEANKASVMYYNGSNWVNLGAAGFTPDEAKEPVLASNGITFYVAFSDANENDKASVMYYTGGSWQYLGTPGFSAGTAVNLDIEFHNNEPYVVYQDAGNGFRATCKKYDGANWVNVGNAGFSPSQVFYNSIAFKDTTPYVAYQDYAGGTYKASVMKYIPCYEAGTPTLELSMDTICVGDSVELRVIAGYLNSALEWVAYEGSCNGTLLGSSASDTFMIAPSTSGIIYVRGEGGCVTPGSCESIPIVVGEPNQPIVQNGEDLSINLPDASFQWLDCNNAFAPISGETNDTYTVSNNGSYAAQVEIFGCIDTTTCFLVDNIGITERNDFQVKLMPNPSNGNVLIEFPEELVGNTVFVYTPSGVLVSKFLIEKGQMNVEFNLVPGIYFLTAQNEKGSLRQVFVIQ